MIIQKITHCTDSQLTQEMAQLDLEKQPASVTWYTNIKNKQSVVHSHPYYEIILIISGSDVRYSFMGDIYTLHPGELVFFPADIYHSGKYVITDVVSDRLVLKVNANIWDEALRRAGLEDAGWHKSIVTISSNSVSAWDLRGLMERMAQIPYINKNYQESILTCELMELQLFLNLLVEEQHTTSPSATSDLVRRAVEYIREHYTNPNLTATALANYTFTSREHLSRAFKEYTMESVHSYIKNLRMQHCRSEITAGRSILDACTNSGFSNYSSFLKSFRTTYGMTPMQFRAEISSYRQRGSADAESVDQDL